ncbi:5' nucleotidase, deoxy (Pyrimidine), cytosolic type C protein (NT5C) [Musa troglodytarum]|uniref:5' nucleotidase, deoxy (Pyrimidine), cytosolic type C protein (NT5C) n=1 Tax=Musa troglodytarum TaxID=320322 RepID=A0A9E7HXS8_9LILI|nr:5' nucleotidase, deoxy (Pyrimidine), cytosolic type C protein (NT5C) [Musa troglodytarum]
MLKREGLRSCSLHLRTLWTDHASAMALNKLFPSASRGFSQMSVANEQGRLRRKHLVRMDIGSSNNLSMRGCSDRHDDVFRRADEDIQKAHVVGPHRHLVNGSKLVFSEDMGLSLVNGDGSCKHGKPLEFPGHLKSEKLAVAVDVDEVLGSFLLALNKFIADCYSSNHSVSEYYVYEFYKIWKCSRAEGTSKTFFILSRQNAIKNHTLEWIEKHYPGLFQEIHFGNHFALDGVSRPKSEICKSLGAHVLIDDNPKYALECAEVGIRVLLFDYHNSYPWCKAGSATSHPMVTKVHNWQEVEQQLFSWIPT